MVKISTTTSISSSNSTISDNRHVELPQNITLPKIYVVPSKEEYMNIFDQIDIETKAGFLYPTQLEEAIRIIWPSAFYNEGDKTNDDNNNSAARSCNSYKNEISQIAIKKAIKTCGIQSTGVIHRNEFGLFLQFISSYMNGGEGFGSSSFTNSSCSQILKKMVSSSLSSSQNNDTIIIKCYLYLRHSIDILHGNATDETVEQIAIVIHECLSECGHRSQRTIHRTLDIISHGTDPIQTIAIFFVDIIYFEIDNGITNSLKPYLVGVMDKNDEFRISANLTRGDNSDDCILLVMNLFGYECGEKLSPQSGMNKFLSACVASRMLKDIFPLSTLGKIIVCIASCNLYKNQAKPEKEQIRTSYHAKVGRDSFKCSKKSFDLVPEFFDDADQEQTMNQSYQMLVETNDEFQLDCSRDELFRCIQRGADLSNRSTGNIFTRDLDTLIDRSLNMCSEVTPALRAVKLYTVYDYHQGIKNIHKSFQICSHNPHLFFHTFRGIPNEREMTYINRVTTTTMKLGEVWASVMAVTISILAAFALLTGGDTPWCFFLGEVVPSKNIPAIMASSRSYQDYSTIPVHKLKTTEDDVHNHPDVKKTVYEALINGQRSVQATTTNDGTHFDNKSAPMAAFIYGHIGTEGINKALVHTDYPMEQGRAIRLLNSLPKHVVIRIGVNIAKVAVSRTDEIEKLLKTITGATTDSDP